MIATVEVGSCRTVAPAAGPGAGGGEGCCGGGSGEGCHGTHEHMSFDAVTFAITAQIWKLWEWF